MNYALWHGNFSVVLVYNFEIITLTKLIYEITNLDMTLQHQCFIFLCYFLMVLYPWLPVILIDKRVKSDVKSRVVKLSKSWVGPLDIWSDICIIANDYLIHHSPSPHYITFLLLLQSLYVRVFHQYHSSLEDLDVYWEVTDKKANKQNWKIKWHPW